MFLGDHGPPFQRGKLSSYDMSLRVPFLIRWPGVGVPGARSTLVSSLDVYPTLVEAAGLDPVDSLHGRSLRPSLENPDATGREHLHAEFHLHSPGSFFPTRTVRNERYQLIHNLAAGSLPFPALTAGGDRGLRAARDPSNADSPAADAWDTFENPPEFELYDLRADPFEWTNLAGDSRYEEVFEELESELVRWRRATEDPLLDPSEVHAMAVRFARQRDRLVAPAVAALVILVVIGSLLGRLRRKGRLSPSDAG